MKIVRTTRPWIARSFSFFWYKRVILGLAFYRYDFETQSAIVAHEIAHCNAHHTEIRFLCMLLAPFYLKKLCNNQEFYADKYAAERGYAKCLIAFLSGESGGGRFHPPHASRREKLKNYEHIRVIPVKDHIARSA